MKVPTVVFFLSDGQIIEAEQGKVEWAQHGAYAHRRDTGIWYHWFDDPSTPEVVVEWARVLPDRVPLTHRAYILLSP